MIGILVTGHCQFASGLTSVLSILVGSLEYCEAVDFSPEEPLEILKHQISEGMKNLAACDAILVFTDIQGGSPYNACVQLQHEPAHPVKIISGANLPSLLTAYLERQTTSNLDEFTRHVIASGQKGISCTDMVIDTEEVDIEYD